VVSALERGLSFYGNKLPRPRKFMIASYFLEPNNQTKSNTSNMNAPKSIGHSKFTHLSIENGAYY
jgi:hypothetical protein